MAQSTKQVTEGISPKVWVPVAVQLIGLLTNFIVSGDFTRSELAQVVSIVLTAAVGYLAPPGTVVEKSA